MTSVRPFLLAALSSGALLHGQTAPFDAWSHRASVQATSPGLTRVELSREVLDASRASPGTSPLSDLRLVSAAGVETPFLMEWPRVQSGRTLQAEDFHIALQGTSTVLEVTVPGNAVVQTLNLQTANRDFIKGAVLEGTQDGAEWKVISNRDLVFRQGEAERLRFDFTPAAWKKLRVTLDDQREGPVGFTGATVLTHEQNDTPVSSEEVRILSREEVQGETRLKLDLGGRSRHLHSLHVVATDPLFQREVKVRVPRDDEGSTTLSATRTIYRIALGERHSEELDIMTSQSLPGRILELRILNGDNPPLQIQKIEGRFSRLALVFHAGEAGTWHLLMGRAGAPVPQYDVASLLGDLDRSTLTTARLGALEANPAFRKEAALPETGAGGAALDTSAWKFRKTVSFAEGGMVRVELDAEVLAHAAPGLRDVRVMQEGRQLPYVIERDVPSREVAVKFQAEPDAKRPSVSRWRVERPFSGYPVDRLGATSPVTLFDRHLQVWEDARDDHGNRFRRTLGSGTWKRVPGQPGAPLDLSLPAAPEGDVIYLETDNGDNAPLEIDALHVAFSPVNVVFKAVSAAPVQLIYGNHRASTPSYDIQLVRAQFGQAEGSVGTLGPEEQTARHAVSPARDSGAGSVWLWLALALVVCGLLWIVARLLPAEAASK